MVGSAWWAGKRNQPQPSEGELTENRLERRVSTQLQISSLQIYSVCHKHVVCSMWADENSCRKHLQWLVHFHTGPWILPSPAGEGEPERAGGWAKGIGYGSDTITGG